MIVSKEDSGNTYAEALFSKYQGKKVEILFDTDWGFQKWADFDVSNKPFIIGQIVGAIDSCLDIEVEISTGVGNVKRLISVNAWNIMSVAEYNEHVPHIFAFTKQILGKQ